MFQSINLFAEYDNTASIINSGGRTTRQLTALTVTVTLFQCARNRTVSISSRQPVLKPEHFQVSHFQKRQLEVKINVLLLTRVNPFLLP